MEEKLLDDLVMILGANFLEKQRLRNVIAT
jgi:hypothetical protein